MGLLTDFPLVAPAEVDISRSVWSRTVTKLHTNAYAGVTHCDVVVLGGGITGLSAALHAAEKGVSVTVLEAGDLGSGASGRNAGMLNPGAALGPAEIVEAMGETAGRRFLEEFGNTASMVRDLCRRHGIQCFDDGKGVIKAAHSRAVLDGVRAYVEQWSARGAPVEYLDQETVARMTGTPAYWGGLIDHRSSCIQPLAYVLGLAAACAKLGVGIYTRSRAISLRRQGAAWRVGCNGGEIEADAVISATNAYADDLIPGLKTSMLRVGGFGMATEPLDAATRATILPWGNGVYDTGTPLTFMRYDPEGRFMIGTAGHLPWFGDLGGDRWANSVVRALFAVKGLEWRYRWSGSMALTGDHLPRLFNPLPGVFAATGCNGRGLGTGTLLGHYLAQCICGTPSEAVLSLKTAQPLRFRTVRMNGLELASRLARAKTVVCNLAWR